MSAAIPWIVVTATLVLNLLSFLALVRRRNTRNVIERKALLLVKLLQEEEPRLWEMREPNGRRRAVRARALEVGLIEIAPTDATHRQTSVTHRAEGLGINDGQP